MRNRTKIARRAGDVVGSFCVVAAVALLSPGVRIVRAGDESPMSVDPALVEAARVRPDRLPAKPGTPAGGPAVEVAQTAPAGGASPSAPPSGAGLVRAEDVENALRPGVSGVEVAPGVIVLNTRGFNYGPPPTPLAPEALKQESAPR